MSGNRVSPDIEPVAELPKTLRVLGLSKQSKWPGWGGIPHAGLSRIVTRYSGGTQIKHPHTVALS